MKAVFVSLCLLAVVGAALASPFSEEETQFLFIKWAKQHGKTYSHDEFFYRYKVFRANLEQIHRHNSEGGHSFTLGMNHMGDMTFEEYRTTMLGYKPGFGTGSRQTAALDTTSLPDSVDWRKKGVVTNVKDQGQCGSCWAFSAVESVESINAIKTGNLLTLSEQQLVDCSGSYGNQGCNGGLMDSAFEYVRDHGLCKESDYSYEARDGSCRASSCQAAVTISSYTDVPSDDEDALQAAVAQQPVSIAIEADQFAFQFYSGGVFESSCGTNLDHGVQIVGYGELDGKKMWIVRNSWNSSWGSNGYIYMIRKGGRTKGECGLAMQPSWPSM